MAGVPTSILDHEVTMGMEATYGGTARQNPWVSDTIVQLTQLCVPLEPYIRRTSILSNCF